MTPVIIIFHILGMYGCLTVASIKCSVGDFCTETLYREIATSIQVVIKSKLLGSSTFVQSVRSNLHDFMIAAVNTQELQEAPDSMKQTIWQRLGTTATAAFYNGLFFSQYSPCSLLNKREW